MLGLAKRCRARFLLTSTSEVYGDPQQHPQVESYWGHVNPIGDRACYDEGKRVAETLVTCYKHEHALDGRIVRIFNTYGPRMALDDGRVVSNFVCAALRGDPLVVHGDGTQTRSFQYVSDLVRGLMVAMDADSDQVDGCMPVNIGNPTEFTILELAEIVRDLVRPGAKIEHAPRTADDPAQRRPDIGRAKAVLGWEPTVPLREGLALMIDDFRARLGDAVTAPTKKQKV